LKNNLSLTKQIYFILVAFIIAVLVMIYFFQNVLLNVFYKNNKINEMISISEVISANLESEDFNDVLDGVTFNNDVSIRIVSNSINTVYYTRNSMPILNNLTEIQLHNFISEINESGGSKLYNNYRFEAFPGVSQEVYIYGSITQLTDESALILIASSIRPMDVTTRTMLDQYKVNSVGIIIFTTILAFILSRLVLKPIKQIEDEAKNLPLGEYHSDKVKTYNSELNSLNLALASANEEINKADKAKKELLSNVSHDLRTPLTMIAGYGEMMKDIPAENNKENIDVIINESKRLSTIVDDLLDISRWQAGKATLNKKDISINYLLKSINRQFKPFCKSNNISFKLELIEDKVVNIDEERIKQVIYNFIYNSINYNDKKKRIITLGTQQVDDKLRVYVLDNGNGIEEKDLNKVFDRYYRIDKQHKRANIGSGIGLSLCKEILLAHNLNYGVESKLNEYSKFYFDL